MIKQYGLTENPPKIYYLDPQPQKKKHQTLPNHDQIMLMSYNTSPLVNHRIIIMHTPFPSRYRYLFTGQNRKVFETPNQPMGRRRFSWIHNSPNQSTPTMVDAASGPKIYSWRGPFGKDLLPRPGWQSIILVCRSRRHHRHHLQPSRG